MKKRKKQSSFPYRALFRVAVFAIFAQGIASGCAGCGCETCEQAMYDTEYRKERDRGVRRFEYEVLLPDMWKELVALLSEQGYNLPPTPVEGRTVESDWTAEHDRMLVHVERINAKHYKVELKRQYEVVLADGGRTLRSDEDTELEWKLVQRVEPTRAKTIEDDADKAGKRAGKVGRGCDKGCEIGCDACIACADTCDRCDKTVKKLSP